VTPLFLSAEHGDGMTDLLMRIQQCIPDGKVKKHKDRQAKRLERFKEYKKMLLDEIVEIKQDQILAKKRKHEKR
jgi:hypothetical protein